MSAPRGTAVQPGRTAVDLFAGTGSATEPFREAGWRVIEIDVRPSVERRPSRSATRIVADCRRLPLTDELRGRVDFLWASPPCTEFSDANARVDHRAKRPSLELVWAAMAAVRDLRPTYWIIENVRGAIPFLGIPVQKIGPFCLWGYFPTIEVSYAAQTYQKASAGRSAVARARIPRELAQAVYQAVAAAGGRSLLDLRPFRRHRHVAARRRAAGPDLFARPAAGEREGEAHA